MPFSTPDPNIHPTQDAATPGRLLESAEAVFAEKGFESASVREITQRAGANLAAVNYHFGGKQKLYRAVFHQVLEHLRDYRLQGIGRAVEANPQDLEGLLRAFARVFLEPLVEAGRGRRITQLILWEMVEPRLPAQLFFVEVVEPISAAFGRALARACPELDSRSTVLCMHSLVGQLIHVLHMERMYAETRDAPTLDLSTLVEHIVRFTAVGMRHLARSPNVTHPSPSQGTP